MTRLQEIIEQNPRIIPALKEGSKGSISYIARNLAESAFWGGGMYLTNTVDSDNAVLLGASYGMARIVFDMIDSIYFNRGRLYDATHKGFQLR